MMFPWIFNGLMMMANAFMGRSSSAENLDKQLEFQAALQSRNWEHTAKMQAEMQERQFREARESAKRSAELHRTTLEEQAFMAAWPLIDTPSQLRNYFRTTLARGERPPLQIVIPTDVSALSIGAKGNIKDVLTAAMRELASFMSSHYSHCSGNRAASKLYTNCTKSPQQGYGTSQLYAIYEVFHLAPTLILNPYCHNNNFCINCSYWDGSDTIKQWTPTFIGPIFSCSIADLQRTFLQDKLDRWKKVKQRLEIDNQIMENLELHLEKERAARENALQNGVSEAEIDEFITSRFAAEYAKLCLPFAGEISDYISKMVASTCRLSTAMLTDMHYLLNDGMEPRFPKICRDEIRQFPLIAEQANALFNKTIEARNERAEYKTRIPLWHAKLASSYSDSALAVYSQEQATKGIRSLRKVLPDPEQDILWPVVSDLGQAVNSLQTLTSTEDDPYLSACKRVLNVRPEELQSKANSAFRASNFHEAFNFWLRAAQCDYMPALYSVGQAYENGIGVQQEPGRAIYYYQRAIDGAYAPAYKKGLLVGNFLISQQKWAESLHYWSFAAIESNAQAIIHTAALLLSSRAESPDSSDVQRWSKAATAYTNTNNAMPAAALALATLQTGAEQDNIIALDYLAILFMHLKGYNIYLFPCDGNESLNDISAATLSEDMEEYLTDVVKKCMALRTPRSQEMFECLQTSHSG